MFHHDEHPYILSKLLNIMGRRVADIYAIEHANFNGIKTHSTLAGWE